MCYGETISSSMLRARKEHRCSDCGKRIAPGDEYHRWTGKFEGDFMSVPRHRRCVDLVNAVRSEHDYDACDLGDPRDLLHEESRHSGWRGLLATVRKWREARRGWR